MSNCLILITNYYPYYKGEEYLESEIGYLSSKYKKIYILATMVSEEMKQTRELPNNVIAITSGIKHSIKGKYDMIGSQLGRVLKNSSKRQIIKLDSNDNLLHKLYCYYFECRAMKIYSELKEKLNEINFDNFSHITIYSYWLYITARVAVELKQEYFSNRDIFTISRAHRYDLYENVAPLKYLPQRRFLMDNLDRVYPCSQDGADILNEAYPAYKDKIEVRRLGTRSNGFLANTTNNKLHIVSCSVVRKVKRLDLLINVLKELENNNIEYLWTHIGDGPEYEKIKRLAYNNLGRQNLKFTGFLENQDVLNWYKENPATIFINLSSSEGVPVSIMEAISKGIPVIATDVGGTKEIVEDGINGYILKADCKVEEILELIYKIKSMGENEYKEMCSNAFNVWKLKCDVEKLYTSFSEELAQNK